MDSEKAYYLICEDDFLTLANVLESTGEGALGVESWFFGVTTSKISTS